MTLRTVRADLHVHSCLSPCGELEMTPMKVVARCLEIGIDAIAVCDHNTAENVMGIQRAAAGKALTVLAGMEVTTSEEVHVLGLFDTAEQALTLQGKVYGRLLPGENDEDLFGIQVVANAQDEVEDIVTRMLIGGTTLPLNDAVRVIHDLGGLAAASHVDRESYSLLGQLGFIPPDLKIDALEVSFRGDPEVIRQMPGADVFPIIRCSDAHRLNELGQATTLFHVAEMSIAEMRKAFLSQNGRRLEDGG